MLQRETILYQGKIFKKTYIQMKIKGVRDPLKKKKQDIS